MDAISPADVTKGGVAPSAEPQTTSKPVSVGPGHPDRSLCELWPRHAVHRTVCVGFTGLASHKLHTSFAQASHKLRSTKPTSTRPNPPQLPPEHLLIPHTPVASHKMPEFEIEISQN